MHNHILHPMKIRIVLPLLSALFILSPILRAQDAMGSAPAAAAGDKEVKTDLDKKMDVVGKNLRKLKKQVSDSSQNDSSLQLLATMEGALKDAMNMTPEKAADLPDDEKAKFMADFKAGLNGMLDEFTKLETAIKAGQNDDAVKIVAEIEALEKKDHKAFRKPKPQS
jgi:soluble cytochrome b562